MGSVGLCGWCDGDLLCGLGWEAVTAVILGHG